MPCTQHNTPNNGHGRGNNEKWKLSNLINNRCEKDENTRSNEIIILTGDAADIKGKKMQPKIIIVCFNEKKIKNFEIPFSLGVLVFKMRLLQISIICSCWSRVALYKIVACSQESGRFTPIEKEQQETGTQRATTEKKINRKLNTITSVRASHRFPFGDNAQVH